MCFSLQANRFKSYHSHDNSDIHNTKCLQYHFTAKKAWMNDPDGLVYFKGKYHMTSITLMVNIQQRYIGDMQYLQDLVPWQHLTIAIYPHNDQ